MGNSFSNSMGNMLAGGLVAVILVYVILPLIIIGAIIYTMSSAVASVKIAPAVPTSTTVVTKFTNFSGSEPEWTKGIPNWAICDWFYVFFVTNVIILISLVLSTAYMAVRSTLPKSMRFSQLLMMMTQIVVSGTSTLFFYVLCNRGLKP